MRARYAVFCLLSLGTTELVATAAGMSFVGVGGKAGNFATGTRIICKIKALEEKSRTLTVVQWVGVNNAKAQGVIPEEVAALITHFLARAREIRKNARTIQEHALANQYQDSAGKLQFIREQEFSVSVPPGAKIMKQMRSGISGLGLNDRVSVTGIGSNFISVGGRIEPGAILVTTDLLELTASAVPGVASFPGAASKNHADKTAPPPNTRMVLTKTGRMVSLNPLSLQSDGGAVIALLIDMAANVGYVHYAEMNLPDLKEGDWIEVTGQLTGKGAVSAQRVRVTTQTPLGLSGLPSPLTTGTQR